MDDNQIIICIGRYFLARYGQKSRIINDVTAKYFVGRILGENGYEILFEI